LKILGKVSDASAADKERLPSISKAELSNTELSMFTKDVHTNFLTKDYVYVVIWLA
jgi:hypothetical protein